MKHESKSPHFSLETLADLGGALRSPYKQPKPLDLKQAVEKADITFSDPKGRPSITAWVVDLNGRVTTGLFNEHWNSLDVSPNKPVFETYIEALIWQRSTYSDGLKTHYEHFLKANQATRERVAELDTQIERAIRRFAKAGYLCDVYDTPPATEIRAARNGNPISITETIHVGC